MPYSVSLNTLLQQDISEPEFYGDLVYSFKKNGVYIFQLIRFAIASSNLNDFNYCNKALTAKRLRQGYRYFKLRVFEILSQTQCLVRKI